MQASLSITNSQSLFKLMSIKSVMPFNHLILCHPLLLLPSIFPSSRVFFNELVLCIRWPKYWSFSFSISPSNEYLGLISFRMDWLDLLGVQGTLKSLLQHHSSKASILQCSVFFMVQLSHPYVTTGKTIALTRWTFFGKGMSLLFDMLSGLVIAFLPRKQHLLISWLQSPSAVILEPTFSLSSFTFNMVDSSDKTWSTAEGNGKPLQYSWEPRECYAEAKCKWPACWVSQASVSGEITAVPIGRIQDTLSMLGSNHGWTTLGPHEGRLPLLGLHLLCIGQGFEKGNQG